MGASHLRIDFGLLVQGLSLSWQFSLRTAGALAGLGELLERSVYEAGSLTRTPDGLSFSLRNPPLRMGAFSAIAVFLDGARVPNPNATLQESEAENPTSLDSVTIDRPIVIPVGRRTRFQLRVPSVSRGTHKLRLELQSVAIPPLVWLEFADVLSERSEPS